MCSLNVKPVSKDAYAGQGKTQLAVTSISILQQIPITTGSDRELRLSLTGNCVFDDRLRRLSALCLECDYNRESIAISYLTRKGARFHNLMGAFRRKAEHKHG